MSYAPAGDLILTQNFVATLLSYDRQAPPVMRRGLEARKVAFAALMGALGNSLFVISQSLQLVSGGQVALDLSHVATFISALYGGPLLGSLVGALVGLGPGLYFGSVAGAIGLYLPMMVLGKSLTGLTAGLLSRTLMRGGPTPKRALLIVPVSFLPECFIIVVFFTVMLPWLSPILPVVLVKAWVEIAFMAFLMGALAGNKGFSDLMKKFLVINQGFLGSLRSQNS